ncbi:hypothetical protein [Vulcanisaeta souniana]|nr:hypothetical protein [Vulcanisaeta souniana]
MLFSTIEEAINKLSTFKEQLIQLKGKYDKINEALRANANIEEIIMKSGPQPSHRVIIMTTIPYPINMHIAPHYAWLVNKISALNDNISYIINEIDKVNNYLNNTKFRDASVAIIIDHESKKTKLVIMP